MCGSNRIRTYDLPGMNRTLWPAELLSHFQSEALIPATAENLDGREIGCGGRT